MLGLAVIYPFLFMVISWALFDGSGSFGALQLLPPDATRTDRLVVLAALTIGPVVAGLILRVGFRFVEFFSDDVYRLLGKIGAPDRLRRVIILIVLSAGFSAIGLVVFVVGAGLVMVAVADAGAVSIAGAGLIAVGMAVTFADADANDGAVTGASACAFALLLVGGGAVAEGGATAYAVATPVTVAVAIAVAVAANIADRRRRGLLGAILLGFMASVPALLLACLDGGWDAIDLTGVFNALSQPIPPEWLPEALGTYVAEAQARRIAWESEMTILVAPLVVFLALLPAVNAPLDWLSLGVSRSLIRWTAGPAAEKPRGRWFEYLIIQFDFMLALLFATGVALMTAAGLALFDRLHILGGGAGVFDTLDYITRLRADPHAQEFWWIYLMMFWTLVPTSVHALTFVFSFVALAPERLGWVRGLANGPAWRTPLVMLAVRIVSLGFAGIALWVPVVLLLRFFDWAFNIGPATYFNGLADMAEAIARWIGGMG